MLLEIKNFKGVATQADKADLGLEFAFKNQNYFLDTPGALVKVNGRGDGVDFSNLVLNDAVYWSPSNLKLDGSVVDPQWLGWDTSGNTLIMINNNVFNNPAPTPIVLGSAYSTNVPTAFDFQDHGTAFRLAPDDLNHKPKILQYISRNFFEGNYNVDEFVFQDATPVYPQGKINVSVNEVEIGENTGLNLPQATYNYKVAPVFDGVQEIPLPESSQSIGPSTDTKMGALTISINKSVATGTAPNKSYALNPRITGLDIFRETNNTGTYYEIFKIPINTKNSDTNKIADNELIFRNRQKFIDNGYPVYAASPATAGSYDALIANDGILSTPDITLQGLQQGNGTNGAFYSWALQLYINDAYDSIETLSESPTFYQTDTVSPVSGMQYDFSGTNGPLNDNSWKFLLSKGIISISDSNNGFISANAKTRAEDASLNFGVRARIVRNLRYINNAGNSVRYNRSNNNTRFFELGEIAFTKDMIIVQIDNSKMGKSLSGGILKSGNVVANILSNVGGAIKVTSNDETNAIATGNYADIYKNYLITTTDEQVIILVNDTGFSNGRMQPYTDKLIVDTRYKYSQMIHDRLFVGNVRIDPDNNAEDHPDWVVYSEPGMPDILPAVNFIQIKDQQGGIITGLNKILDSLVVFMTRGIFRLDVSSGSSPSSFILMEAEKNVGCIAPRSIVSAKDNLFFAAPDNIYQITPDFRFAPITLAIRDTYQSVDNLDKTRLFFDVQRNRLLCRFGQEKETIYIFNLDSLLWTTMKFTDNSPPAPNFFSIADNLDLYAIRQYTPQSEKGEEQEQGNEQNQGNNNQN